MRTLSEKNITELCDILSNLIQRQSVSGGEKDVVEYLKTVFAQFGFDEVFVDEYGSITATMRGQKPGPSILFDAHIDTVPVPDPTAWSENPFGGKVKDGRLYGRGASDMKGALAAMIQAAGLFAEETGRDFCGSVSIAGVVFEECFEGIAARKISERVKPDYVVIGEASELNLKCGQRGRAEIVVETFGKPAHSANPQKGINAVYKMMKLIDAVGRLTPSHHPVLGDGILELTDIKSSPYPGASVVPDYCRATYDRRLLIGETPAGVLAPIQKVIDALAAQDGDFSAKVSFARASLDCYTGGVIEGERFFPGWLFDENGEFVKKAFAALESAGLSPEITQYSFCTNGSHYAGEAGIRTIGFGPSRENLAHTVDEHIEVSQLTAACAGYIELMRSFLR